MSSLEARHVGETCGSARRGRREATGIGQGRRRGVEGPGFISRRGPL